jgi:type 1 glutamine amidotransferase
MSTNILIIASPNEDHHKFEDYAEKLTTILQQNGYEPKAEKSLDIVKHEGGLTEFDVIIFCGRHVPRPLPPHGDRDEVALIALENFVHSGKGLIITHIASSSFEPLPRRRKLLGRVWEYGGYSGEPFTSSHPPIGKFWVNFIDREHPITKDLDDFKIDHDERYQNLLVAPDAKTHDLAVATVGKRTEPIIWIVEPPEGGRVFHNTLGHDLSTYDNEGLRNC